MFKKSLIAFLVKIVGTGFSFLYYWYISHELKPMEAGVLFTLFAFTLLLSSISRLGADHIVVKFVSSANFNHINNSNKIELFTVFMVIISSSVIIVLLSILGNIFIRELFNSEEISFKSYFSIVASVIFISSYNFFVCILNGLQRNILATWILSGYSQFIALLLSFVWINFYPSDDKFSIFSLGYFISSLLVAFSSFVCVWKYFIPNKKVKLNFSLLRQCKSVFPGVIFDQVINNIPQLIVGSLLIPIHAAGFAIGLKITNLVFFIFSSINTVVTPKFSRFFSISDFESIFNEFYTTRRMLIFITFPSVFVIILLSNVILGFFGKFYENYSTMLIILLLSQLAHAFFGPALSALIMTNNFSYYRISMFIGAFSTVTFVYLLGQIYDINGAAAGITIGVLLQKFTGYILFKKTLNIHR